MTGAVSDVVMIGKCWLCLKFDFECDSGLRLWWQCWWLVSSVSRTGRVNGANWQIWWHVVVGLIRDCAGQVTLLSYYWVERLWWERDQCGECVIGIRCWQSEIMRDQTHTNQHLHRGSSVLFNMINTLRTLLLFFSTQVVSALLLNSPCLRCFHCEPGPGVDPVETLVTDLAPELSCSRTLARLILCSLLLHHCHQSPPGCWPHPPRPETRESVSSLQLISDLF